MTTTETSGPLKKAKRVGNPYVARVFFLWGMLFFVVLVAGLGRAVVEGDLLTPFVPLGPRAFLDELSRFSARGLLALGLVLALLLPLVRNAGVVFVMLRRKERLAALLAGGVWLALVGLYAFLWLSDLLPSSE